MAERQDLAGDDEDPGAEHEVQPHQPRTPRGPSRGFPTSSPPPSYPGPRTPSRVPSGPRSTIILPFSPRGRIGPGGMALTVASTASSSSPSRSFSSRCTSLSLPPPWLGPRQSTGGECDRTRGIPGPAPLSVKRKGQRWLKSQIDVGEVESACFDYSRTGVPAHSRQSGSLIEHSLISPPGTQLPSRLASRRRPSVSLRSVWTRIAERRDAALPTESVRACGPAHCRCRRDMSKGITFRLRLSRTVTAVSEVSEPWTKSARPAGCSTPAGPSSSRTWPPSRKSRYTQASETKPCITTRLVVYVTGSLAVRSVHRLSAAGLSSGPGDRTPRERRSPPRSCQPRPAERSVVTTRARGRPSRICKGGERRRRSRGTPGRTARPSVTSSGSYVLVG